MDQTPSASVPGAASDAQPGTRTFRRDGIDPFIQFVWDEGNANKTVLVTTTIPRKDGDAIKASFTVPPFVFPPESEPADGDVGTASLSTRLLYEPLAAIDYGGKRVLDMGTGTGVLAAVALYNGAAPCDTVAVDIQASVAECARQNLKRLGFGDVAVMQGDLFEPVPSQRFDVIIANLPIVPRDVDHECELAFFDPWFAIHHRFFKALPDHLTDDGIVFMSHQDAFGTDTSFDGLGLLERTLLQYNLSYKVVAEAPDSSVTYRLYEIRQRV
eukprot:TRINITY_DN48706_c0_g1_i1.p1 TRINITY_DN48706_c0_g1~~TRINITY_DN48706_c0_g1_i1.p1  ORF type:complete len:271 (-),score=24.30 TRINITY_DN48706_c0_g1_i1:233-1045(-)